MAGQNAYVLGTDYTTFGEPQQYTLATTGDWTWLTNTYEQGTRRLSEQSVQRQASTTSDLDTHYTYDPAGNILQAADNPSGGSTDVQCYNYDYLQRLTQAWTTGNAPTTTTPNQCQSQPAAGSPVTGAAPYWQTFGYDVTGDRTQETDHSTTGNTAGDTTHTYAYPAAGQAQPHTLRSVATAGTQPPAGNDTTGYDSDGNATTRTVAGTTQTLSWDDQNQLSQISDSSGNTSGYVYDADGNEIERRDPTATTLYLPGERTSTDKADRSLPSATTPSADKTSRCAPHQGCSGAATDQQGTADLQINATSQAVTQRRFTPYGQPLSNGSGTWTGDKGYIQRNHRACHRPHSTRRPTLRPRHR